MNLFLNQNEEQENDIETNSLDQQHIEYVTSTIRDLGKHLSDISREEIIE